MTYKYRFDVDTQTEWSNDLVLVRSDAGWSLHQPEDDDGSNALLSGPNGVYNDTLNEWTRPNRADYFAAITKATGK